MTTTLFEDLKAYVGFGEADVAALNALGPFIEPQIGAIVDHFYECILRHPNAHAAIVGGHPQVDRLKATLSSWLRTALEGPFDEAYFERRSKIGRMHVRIDLPQRYMLTAMDVIRTDVRALIEDAYGDSPESRKAANEAIDRLFDMELAIMLETYKEDSESRLRRRERLATLGQLAATVGHELRNPLGVIESSLFLLRRKVGEEPAVTRHLDKIANQVTLTGQIVNDLLELTRESLPRTETTEVDKLVDEAVAEIRVPPHIRIRKDIPAELSLTANPRLLRRALVNLFSNSIRAMKDREGEIAVHVTREEAEVVISVLDQGPGFDADVLPEAFEPLVTKSEDGIGLGLALVKRVLERHGGRARAANRPEGGAVVQLSIPQGNK